MSQSNKFKLLGALIILVEVLVFWWANYISPSEDLIYQLAARYSGRLSFLIFASLLLFTGAVGIKHIFKSEKSKNDFILLLTLFALNHVIHFYYLAVSHWVKDETLLIPKNIIGATAYLLLIVSPFYLKNRALSNSLYWSLQSFLLVLAGIFFGSYARRLILEFEYPTEVYVLYPIIIAIGTLVLLNSYRVFKESSIKI